MRRSFAAFGLVVLLSPVLDAQQMSAGASYTLLSLTYPDQMPQGIGGWFTWDSAGSGLSAGADLGVNVFPEDHPLIGRQTQLLAGVRAGVRTGRVAFFGRVRPGMMHFSERFFAPDIACILIFPPPDSCLIDSTNLAMDAGGTVEFYPSQRSVIRVDAGDTLIRFGREGRDPAWKHNLQFAAGGGLRF